MKWLLRFAVERNVMVNRAWEDTEKHSVRIGLSTRLMALHSTPCAGSTGTWATRIGTFLLSGTDPCWHGLCA